jgi:hypothetical protein
VYLGCTEFAVFRQYKVCVSQFISVACCVNVCQRSRGEIVKLCRRVFWTRRYCYSVSAGSCGYEPRQTRV